MLQIREARDKADYQIARELSQEYEAALGFDLGLQDSESEVASLPGAYAPPRGCLLLVESGGAARGCVALRPLSEGICELKRLHVRSGSRGRGLERVLAVALIRKARELGYSRMRLDTPASMSEATRLYEDVGFREIAPYRHNPMRGARFFELDLKASEPAG